MNAYWKAAAGVGERILITGQLKLTTPTNLSNGDTEGLTDISLRRDPVNGRPVLPSTSLAGALRDYARRRAPAGDQKYVETLFGQSERETSRRSWLFIDDALGDEAGIEIRDGVAIDPRTRTAADSQKFDLELLAAGTTFDLSLELWLPRDDGRTKLLQIVAIALDGLARGDIRLGTRKRRGFGGCRVAEWQVYRYDMGDPQALLRWLDEDRSVPAAGDTLAARLGLAAPPVPAAAPEARLTARLAVDGSLLIRSAPTDADGPDMVHLRDHAGRRVVPGTSLAGALRARAGRIARVFLEPSQADGLVDDLFGPRLEKRDDKPRGDKPRGGRLWVDEAVLEDARDDAIQSRVKIDRFTGGSYPGALFDQQPVWAGAFTVDLRLDRPAAREVGLLLLLLKDLWTGDLPIGGESSVGRGRLRGEWARLEWNGQTWRFDDVGGGRLRLGGDPAPLQAAVAQLATKERA